MLHNRAARQVTKLSWYTPVRRLLKQCNWLSINQLIFYHSALTVYRTKVSSLPVYLNQHLTSEHPYNTRQSTSGGVRQVGSHGYLVDNSFLRRAGRDYNEIPANIRSIRTLAVFKKRLRQWVETNIPLDW